METAELEVRVAPDGRWWPSVAGLIRQRAQAGTAPGLRDLRRVVVIVPSPIHAPDLRLALHGSFAGQAFIAPRIVTLEAWAQFDPAQSVVQRVELYQALRESAWVRGHFGTQSSALWALARDLGLLSDELTLAAFGAVDAFEGRWRAAVQRSFSQRAAAAADPQSQLVLALWRASLLSESGAAGLRGRLEQLSRNAAGPLVWLVPQGAAPWQRAYCRAYTAASGQAACLVVGDMPALAAQHPWLGAAWPELTGCAAAPAGASEAAEDFPPIAERARFLTAALSQGRAAAAPGVVQAPMRILQCESLEEEASAAANWTVDRLRAGARSVALVALDRLTARRVRALLERVGVLVADESGWKVSTTSAAAAVIRWLDLVIVDFAGRDLIDWMHSPFTLNEEALKTEIVAATQAALLEGRVVCGKQAVRAALMRRARRTGAGGASEALRVVQDLLDLAEQWQRPGSLGRFLGLLWASLDRMGMRAALARDPVGRTVLQAIEQLHAQLIGSSLRLDLNEFRAFLAEHCEQLSAVNREIDSPVVMITLGGTRLRRFDAALLVGADADHLPAARAAGGLMANAVRQDLGLRTDQDREREQTQDLAALMALSASVDATWRCRRQDEPLPLSPLLERLAMIAELAGAESTIQAPVQPGCAVAAQVSAVRAPAAPGLLPRRVSASAYQDLVDCPYRFFALRMLGLHEAQRLRARPDKRDFGLLLHAVLFEFHRTASAGHVGGAEHEVAECQRLRRIIDDALAPLLQQRPALIGYRQRLRLLVPGYVAWDLQTRRDGWRWQQGEVVLERPLAGAATFALALHGRVDRIDVQDGGARRVLDYKSRDGASLRRAQRDAGEDVQLLFYGLLLDPPPQEAAYVSLQRPADSRAPTQNVVTLVSAPQPLAEQSAALESTMTDVFARIGAGARLPANGAEAVCRRCELRSLCRHGFTDAEPGLQAAALDGAGLR